MMWPVIVASVIDRHLARLTVCRMQILGAKAFPHDVRSRQFARQRTVSAGRGRRVQTTHSGRLPHSTLHNSSQPPPTPCRPGVGSAGCPRSARALVLVFRSLPTS